MDQKKVRLAKPEFPDEVIIELEKLLQSGLLTQGTKVKEFEKLLSEYLDVSDAVVVSSGTAALHLALLVSGVQKGDEVIIPAFSFAATLNVVKICGATPVFVDVNIDDCCIDVTKLESYITAKTKVIMPVHEFGAVADMQQIMSIAERYNLLVVEDAACAIGSDFRNKKAGTFGDLGCFSFHPRKMITTGEGGVIVTNNSPVAEKLRLLRNHGCAGSANRESFLLSGLNYRMTDIQAVLGISHMSVLEGFITHRQKIAETFSNNLSRCDQLRLPKVSKDVQHSYQSYHIVVANPLRDKLRDYLYKNNIESNLGAQYLPGLGCMEITAEDAQSYPNAWRAYNDGLVLPIGSHIDDDTAQRITDTVVSFFDAQE